MPTKKKPAKKSGPAFHYPAKGERCEKQVAPKTAFHKGAFRNRLVKAGKKMTILLVGCPKKAKVRGSDKTYSTQWLTTPAAIKSFTQCRFKAGPMKGKRAGMQVHIITEKAKKACPRGFKRPKKRAA
jgi:hypothetical protein